MKKFPTIKGKAVLSPMSGVTDIAFRILCKNYGAALTYTEFVSGTAILHAGQKSLDMIKTVPEERPVAIQLFGNSFDDVAEAAKQVEEDFDIIDVNCGCPAWKVIKTGAGSAMLNDPEKIKELITKIKEKVDKPVTVKIRTGITDKSINAVEVAKIAEKAGAAAIAIHGRTQKQGYSGVANWDIIKEVKEAVNIPLIGNGDVFTPEDFKEKLEYSKVDFIMIARGAMTNPYIFKQINDYLETGKYDKKSNKEMFLEYLELAEKYSVNFSQIKNHSIQFTKGIVGGNKLRPRLSQCKTIEEVKEVYDSI